MTRGVIYTCTHSRHIETDQSDQSALSSFLRRLWTAAVDAAMKTVAVFLPVVVAVAVFLCDVDARRVRLIFESEARLGQCFGVVALCCFLPLILLHILLSSAVYF